MIASKPIHKPVAYTARPDGWTWSRLDQVTEGVFDCPHSTPHLTDDGPYVVRTQDIITGTLRLDSCGHVSRATYEERIARAEPRHGDLLYSREGTYFGIAAEVPPSTQVCLGQRMVLIRPKADLLHFRYLRYWLNSPIIAAHIHGFRDGTVAERLNLPTIRALPIIIPPLDKQHLIAEALGSLDDKIELNRRINKTLEDLAAAVFKAWFIDFAPVKAKAAGAKSFPSMPQEVFDALPDTQVDVEYGEVPEGWIECRVEDFADINRWTLGKNDPLGVIDYIEISEVARGNIANVSRYERGREPSRARRRLQNGDTVLSTVRPDRGSYFLCLQPAESLVASTGFAVLTPKTGDWAFLYSALTRAEVGDELGRLADGGAYPAVRPETIAALPLVLPRDSRGIAAFESIARPMYESAHRNRNESSVLAALRDTLLPKLLSGEVREAQQKQELIIDALSI